MFVHHLPQCIASTPSVSGHRPIAHPYAWAHVGDGTVDRRSQWRVSQWTTQATSPTGSAATDALAGGPAGVENIWESAFVVIFVLGGFSGPRVVFFCLGGDLVSFEKSDRETKIP